MSGLFHYPGASGALCLKRRESSAACSSSSFGLLDEVSQSSVDVLASFFLVAVDRQHVAARLEGAGGLRPKGDKPVSSGVPIEPGNEFPIDVDFRVLVVVNQQMRCAQRFRVELERTPQPDVVGLPVGVYQRPGVPLVPNPLAPLDQVESSKSGLIHELSGALVV